MIVLEKKKQYNEKNKDVIKEKRKQYYEQNKDIICENRKIYSEENKTIIRERRMKKITCCCGVDTRKADIRKHERTKKHQAFIHDEKQTAETI